MAKFWKAAGNMAAQLGLDLWGENRQVQRERDLMGLENRYDREMLELGHDKQFEMWQKTNFPAQLEMMKKAGLSPGLMYGGGPGSGGTTGSQTGKSSASGSASPSIRTDMMNIRNQMADVEVKKAQTENIQQDTINKKGEASLIDANVKNVNQDTLKKVEETSNLKTEGELLEFKKELEGLKVSKKVTGSAFVDMLTQLGLDPVNNIYHQRFLQGLLGSLGLIKAGTDIAKIYATIKSRGLNKPLGESGLNLGPVDWKNKEFINNKVIQAPKGLGLPK